MSGARHREEGRLRGRTAIYRHAGLDAHCPDAKRRIGDRDHQSIRQSDRLVFLTFLGVMVGSMADHYEHATDETNDSSYSNTYDTAPANPGEYYDRSEQQ